jgi:hypothetical protein
MINVKNIVKNLNDDTYTIIAESLNKNKAEKFLTLLNFYKNTELEDEELIEKLELKKGTFYTLKSRLYDKIQEVLTSTMNGEKVELLKQVQNIPDLLYNGDRETSIAILKKLEEDLLEYDMPMELCEVLTALKKINFNNFRRFDYSKKYNKFISIKLAIDKSEDLFTKINFLIAEYSTTKNKEHLENILLSFNELERLNKLYESHHINFFFNIINVAIWFIPELKEQSEKSKSIVDVLDETKSIVKKYREDDKFYQYYEVVLDYYYYLYYHNFGLNKKAKEYSSEIFDRLNSFFLMNHAVFCSNFLMVETERYVSQDKQHLLISQYEKIKNAIFLDKDDVPNYINYQKFNGIALFYKQNYKAAVNILLNLQRDIVFKNHPHAEIDFKLFLALNYAYLRDEDNLVKILKSVTRNVKESANFEHYDHVMTFIKLLKVKLRKTSNPVSRKVNRILNEYKANNIGSFKVLSYLLIDEEFVDLIKERF